LDRTLRPFFSTIILTDLDGIRCPHRQNFCCIRTLAQYRFDPDHAPAPTLDIVLADLHFPDKAALETAMKGHVTEETELIGMYKRKPDLARTGEH
jgi:hypothetical protein